jgi:hypothetical protein
MVISGMVLPGLGLKPPEMPKGADAGTTSLYFVLGSMLLAFVISFVSRNLEANWLVRWVILSELTWNFGVAGMVLDSLLFMTTGAVSSITNVLFTLLSFLPSFLLLSALVAALFRPEAPVEPCLDCLQNYFSGRKPIQWIWRLGSAVLAYPLVYFTFGLMVNPFIQKFYSLGQYELSQPTWEQLIPLQLARSILFLLVSLPVLAWWRGSKTELWLKLGASIFVLTAFMAVIASYWFPWELRLFHGLELLADAMVYSAALAVLLWKGEKLPLGKQGNLLKRAVMTNAI